MRLFWFEIVDGCFVLEFDEGFDLRCGCVLYDVELGYGYVEGFCDVFVV